MKVAEHVRRVGTDQPCSDLNRRDAALEKGDYYVFAIDRRGTRAHILPISRRWAPTPGQDADGRFFCRELIDVAQTAGFGWCDFKDLNPPSGRIEPKSVYLERVGELILGCAIYLQHGTPNSAATQRVLSGGRLRTVAAAGDQLTGSHSARDSGSK